MMVVAERSMKQLTDNEELFSKFFNSEMVLISAMSEAEKIDHIKELEEIAFEAKARLTAAKSNQRDSAARRRVGSEWSISAIEPDQTTSDTINRVKLREKRMSKLDKTRAQLEKLGLEKKDIDVMISAMQKTASNSADAESTRRELEAKAERDEHKKNGGDDNESTLPVAKAEPKIKPNSPVAAPLQFTKENAEQADGRFERGNSLDLSTLKFK